MNGSKNEIQMLADKYFGGENANKSYMQVAGQTLQLGGMGSVSFGNKGKTQSVAMGLDADTSLILTRSGMMEIERSFGGGYSLGLEGPYKAGINSLARTFTRDQNTSPEKNYDFPTMAANLAHGMKNFSGYDPSENMAELTRVMQEQTKEIKKLFAKIASKDGYF